MPECPSLDRWKCFSFGALRSEVRGALTVLRVFTGKKDIVATGTKNLFENSFIELLGRIN